MKGLIIIKRLTIALSERALEIYNKIKPHDRSKYVSDAIIEKFESTDRLTEDRVREIIQSELDRRGIK